MTKESEDVALTYAVKAHQEALCTALWQLRNDNVMCDVKLEFQEGTLGAHGIVLGTFSPYLKERCLEGSFGSQGNTTVLSIANHSYKTCLKVLEFIYTGHCGALSCGERKKFYALCKEWAICKPEELLSDSEQEAVVSKGGRKRTSQQNKKSLTVKRLKTRSNKEDEVLIKLETQLLGIESKLAQEENEGHDHVNEFAILSDNPESVDVLKSESTHQNDSLSDEGDDEGEDLLKGTEEFYTPKDKGDVHLDTVPDHHSKRDEKSDKIMDKTLKHISNRLLKEEPLSKSEKFEKGGKKKKGCGLYHDKSNVECKACVTKFRDRNLLLAHNVEHHWSEDQELPQIFPCEFPSCEYKTHNRWSWHTHRVNAHPTDRSICDVCGKSLKNEASLKQHKLNLHSAAPRKEFPCSVCQKVFKAEVNLQKHLQLAHQGQDPRETFICPYCAHICLRSASLSEHLYKKHDILPPNGKGYQCQHCDFKSINPAELKRHEPRHRPESEQPFRCNQCERGFPTKGQLTEHYKKHKSEKNHRCNYCEYSSKYSHNLQAHIQVRHEKADLKPWSCDECSYCCNSKGNLYKHLRNVHKRTIETKWSLKKVGASKEGVEHETTQLLPDTDNQRDIDQAAPVLGLVPELKIGLNSQDSRRPQTDTAQDSPPASHSLGEAVALDESHPLTHSQNKSEIRSHPPSLIDPQSQACPLSPPPSHAHNSVPARPLASPPVSHQSPPPNTHDMVKLSAVPFESLSSSSVAESSRPPHDHPHSGNDAGVSSKDHPAPAVWSCLGPVAPSVTMATAETADLARVVTLQEQDVAVTTVHSQVQLLENTYVNSVIFQGVGY